MPSGSEPTQTRVQAVLESGEAAVFPGVYDTLSAKLAEDAGFPLAFVSGYAVSATFIGEPDLGLLTQTEIVDRARRICRSVEIPIIVDADTGYGNPLNVVRTVHELIDAGAAGCFLEDQVWPKRCGHMGGKQVIGRGDYLDKIRAAVDAKRGRDFFIVARTDALAVVNLNEAVARVDAAKAEGADATFIEAPGSVEELAAIGRRAPKPTVANMVERGRTPLLPKTQLADLGFQLILYPLTGLYAAARALQRVYRTLLTEGTTSGTEQALVTFEEFNRLIGVEDRNALAARYRHQS
jgi:methylisocitrate lyase